MSAVQRFHQDLRHKARIQAGDQQRDVGRFQLSQIANMDQTPLPFSFTGGPTYADKGAKTVWVKSGASGMEKRQCTAQLTIFADGQPRVKPLIIFREKNCGSPWLRRSGMIGD